MCNTTSHLTRRFQVARSTALKTKNYVFDANARVYCGCGASFCLALERQQRNQPTRRYRNMVHSFRGDVVSGPAKV